MNQHLFVYGTLAPGEPNHHRMEHLEGTWEAASTCGRVDTQTQGVHTGLPCFIPAESGNRVNGFVFTSTQLEPFWPELDAFEGAEYGRKLVNVLTASGKELKAYVYVDLKSIA